jgi:hypothetical protein
MCGANLVTQTQSIRTPRRLLAILVIALAAFAFVVIVPVYGVLTGIPYIVSTIVAAELVHRDARAVNRRRGMQSVDATLWPVLTLLLSIAIRQQVAADSEKSKFGDNVNLVARSSDGISNGIWLNHPPTGEMLDDRGKEGNNHSDRMGAETKKRLKTYG